MVLNSVWVQLTVVPPVSALRVTVSPGVVREPPAANFKPACVPAMRYGAGVFPRKVLGKLGFVGSAVQPGVVVVGQYLIVSGEVVAVPPL